MRIIIINGPNLNLLGIREPEIYGNRGFEGFFNKLMSSYKEIELSYFQSNVEGEIINKIQEVGFTYNGIILNAGGYTHTSIAISDCIGAIKSPVIEVHISNILAREDYRKVSLIASKCKGSISGFGLDSYRLALESFIIPTIFQ